MKKFIDIIENLENPVEESVLTEGQNYATMFTPIETLIKTKLEPALAADPEIGGEVDMSGIINTDKKKFSEFMDMAKKSFKKNDRIVWFLKQVRYMMLGNLLAEFKKDSVPFNEINNVLKKEYASMQVKNLYTYQALVRMVTMLEHSFSLPIPEIQNTVFTNQDPNELIGHFHDLEKEWKDKQNQVLNHTPEEEALFETLIKFPDGKVWVNLHRPHCRQEGKAMGHCGNTASPHEGDNVLSLREPIKHGNEIKWRPLLTFILHEDGNLGEMKGRGNQKPSSQYHNYIIELLKLPIIKGITGGGYAPERNFAITDLPEKEQDALVEMKPALGTLLYQYNRFGMTDDIIKQLKNKVNDILGSSTAKEIEYLPEEKIFVIETFKTVGDFIKEYKNTREMRRGGGNSLEYVYKVVTGDEYLDTFDWVQDSNIEDLINDLPKDLEKGLLVYCKKAYPNYFDQEDGHEETLYEILKENGDDLLDSFRRAAEDGMRAGTEHDMYKDFVKCLREWTSQGFRLKFTESDNEHIQFDDPVKMIIDAPELIDALSNPDFCETVEQSGRWVDRDDGPTLEEPYNGWSDYDEKAAFEYLKGETDLSELAKEDEKDKKESIEYFKKKL